MGNINNWKKVKLGDVCIVKRGSSPRPIEKFITKDKNGINWIKIGDTSLNSKYIIHTAQKIIPEGMNKSCFVQAGDFLLSNSMSFGRPYILKIDGCIHDGWLVLKDNKNLFNKIFLYYYLSSPSVYNRFKHMAVGGVVNNLNSEMVKKLDLPLASPDEQKRIADILDKATELIALRKQQIEKLDLLVKSRFIEMFGDPVQNEKGWPIVALEEIAAIRIGPFGSLIHKEDYIEGGHALVNPSHIVEGKIRIDSRLTISPEKYNELNAYHLEVDDIVLGRRGEMGRCAVIHSAGLLCGTGSMIIRPNKRMKPYFLQTILSSPTYKKTIENRAVGITMMNLNVPTVSALPIPLLPLDLQENFIAILQQVDKTKSTLQQSLEKLELNYKALMQTYFG